MNVRQRVLEAEFRDIRVTVSFVDVSGFGGVLWWLVCSHIFVYSLPFVFEAGLFLCVFDAFMSVHGIGFVMMWYVEDGAGYDDSWCWWCCDG